MSEQHSKCLLIDIQPLATAALYVQVYGFGLSEEFLQDFMRQTGTQPVIATKFAPLPWRFREQNVVEACK